MSPKRRSAAPSEAQPSGVARLRVRQVRSAIGYRREQRQTLRGLRLGRLGRVSELEDTPAVRGMLQKVSHLVRVEEVR